MLGIPSALGCRTSPLLRSAQLTLIINISKASLITSAILAAVLEVLLLLLPWVLRSRQVSWFSTALRSAAGNHRNCNAVHCSVNGCISLQGVTELQSVIKTVMYRRFQPCPCAASAHETVSTSCCCAAVWQCMHFLHATAVHQLASLHFMMQSQLEQQQQAGNTPLR